jgi:hypothetical protein
LGEDLFERFGSELSEDGLDDGFLVIAELLCELFFCGVSDDFLEGIGEVVVHFDFRFFCFDFGEHAILCGVGFGFDGGVLFFEFAEGGLSDGGELSFDGGEAGYLVDGFALLFFYRL